MGESSPNTKLLKIKYSKKEDFDPRKIDAKSHAKGVSTAVISESLKISGQYRKTPSKFTDILEYFSGKIKGFSGGNQ